MKNNKWLLILIFSFLLISILLIAAFSLFPQKTRIQYEMTAFVVDSTGAVTESFALAIDGTIRENKTSSYLDLNIDLPEDFRYSFVQAEPNGNTCMERWASHPGDFVTCGYSDKRFEDGSAWTVWGINTEKEYFIAYWGEDFGQFVVASTDPNVKPEEILEHFRTLIDQYPYTT